MLQRDLSHLDTTCKVKRETSFVRKPACLPFWGTGVVRSCTVKLLQGNTVKGQNQWESGSWKSLHGEGLLSAPQWTAMVEAKKHLCFSRIIFHNRSCSHYYVRTVCMHAWLALCIAIEGHLVLWLEKFLLALGGQKPSFLRKEKKILSKPVYFLRLWSSEILWTDY